MRISVATTKAIQYACLHFHYARSVPVVSDGFNIFNAENQWCGVILYGFGANRNIARPYNLCQGEVLELLRVALNGKQETTSQAVAMTLRELHRKKPHVKIIVSYADKDQNHTGTIYQATNWIYTGLRKDNSRSAFIIHGKKVHPKSLHHKINKQSLQAVKKLDPNAKEFFSEGKHKYLYIFDKKLRKKWLNKSKPYPRRGDNDDQNRSVSAS